MAAWLCTVQRRRGAAALLAAVVLSAPLAPPSARPQTDGGPGRENRTVSWYADRPRERAAVQLACLDDPGRLGGTPDCINAQRASEEVALRDARLRDRAMRVGPDDPLFWTADPSTRAAKLSACRMNPSVGHCEAARRSLEIEAGLARR